MKDGLCFRAEPFFYFWEDEEAVAFGGIFGNSPLRRDRHEQSTESSDRENAGLRDWLQ